MIWRGSAPLLGIPNSVIESPGAALPTLEAPKTPASTNQKAPSGPSVIARGAASAVGIVASVMIRAPVMNAILLTPGSVMATAVWEAAIPVGEAPAVSNGYSEIAPAV